MLVRYGLDVVVISLIVSALSFVLKRTVLKERLRMVTLIAYAAGMVIYAVYISIAEGDALFAFKNFANVLERGLAIGTLAALICAGLEKFAFGGDGNALIVIEALIDKLVPCEKLEECAKALLAAVKDGAENLAAILAEILAAYAEGADGAAIECAAENICAAFEDTDEEENTTE